MSKYFKQSSFDFYQKWLWICNDYEGIIFLFVQSTRNMFKPIATFYNIPFEANGVSY